LDLKNAGGRLTSRVGPGEAILTNEKFLIPIYSVLPPIPTKISALWDRA